MSRARNIKPSFFDNEDLAEMPYQYRLLFIGLWILSDREGRLENRPKRIKKILFSFDDIDVQSGLEELQKYKFITLYEIAGQSVIQIDNFTKHQSPHGLEKDSELPDSNGYYTVHERKHNKTVTGKKQLFKELPKQSIELNQGDTEIKTVIELLDNDTSRVSISSNNALNVECGILNPDLLNDESLKACPPESDAPIAKPEKYKDECEDIFQHWKQVMGKSNQTLFSPERKRVIKARLNDGYTMDQLKDAITGCSKSEYHMGKNDTSTTYNELTLILRDATKVDKFLETTTKSSPQNASGPNQPTYTPSSEIKKSNGPSEFAKQQHAEYMARKNGVQQ